MKYLLAVVCCLLAFSSCNPAAKFELVDVDARLAGLTGVRGEVVVRNDGRRSLTIDRAGFTLRLAGRKVAAATLVEPIVVPAREVSRVDFRLRLTDVSLGALGALRQAQGSEQVGELVEPRVTVDVDGEARLGGGRKKIRLRNVPISEIIHTFER